MNWTLTRDADGLAWLTIATPGAGLNTLSKEAMAELSILVDALEASPPKALVIRSGKTNGFIAGANIEEFTTLKTPEQARELVARGWHLFNRVAALRFPTLALIQGVCLGGGLELSLACRYRVAVDDPSTKLGLPEVMLGILPGWGGIARLPSLTGPQAALDLMLTGKTVDARRARRMGMVDLAVAPRVAEASARWLLASNKPRARAKGMNALMNWGPMRAVVAHLARKSVAQKVRQDQYPAPYAIIDCWLKHQGDSLKDPKALDALVLSPTTANLVRVFFLQERLKGFGKSDASKVDHVHVIGAGTMGGDIAAWCALRGHTVTLQDQSLARIQPALSRAASLFGRRLRDPLRARAAMDRLMPDPEGAGVAKADLVIEAIFESLEAKHSLFRTIEPKLKPSAILASNTSSLRLEDLATVLARPERLVGIHFFNPVAQLPLVEVIGLEQTDPNALSRSLAFVKGLDKLPLPVKSAPGFLVNAVLAPYMLAAMRAVDEGLSPEAIDQACRNFGMPMGPLELADTVGLDIAMAAGQTLAADGQTAPSCLQARVNAGDLGKKSGKGFYTWTQGRASRQPFSGSLPAGLAERLLQPLVDRAERLVAEGVVADADLADAGVIFGTGFPPFRGGPLHWSRQ